MAIRPDPCLYRRRPTNALKEGLRQRSATSTRQRSVSGISSPFCKRKLVGSWLKVMPPDGRAAPANCPRTGRLSLRILLPAARRGAILRLSRRAHRRSPAWRRRRQRGLLWRQKKINQHPWVLNDLDIRQRNRLAMFWCGTAARAAVTLHEIRRLWRIRRGLCT